MKARPPDGYVPFMITILILASSALWPGLQDDEASLLRQGYHELSLHLSPDVGGAVGDTIFLELGYGIFAWDDILFRATLSYNVIEDVVGPQSDYKAREFDLVAEYHIDFGEAFVPYLGLQVGWRVSEFGNDDESGVVYGPRVGMKIFLAKNVAIDLHGVFKFASEDVFVNDFKREDNDVTSMIGLKVLY